MQWHSPNCRIAETVSQYAFKFVAVIADLAHLSNINLRLVSCVKVVNNFRVPITVESYGALLLIGQDSETRTLILVSVVANHTHIGDTNFCQVGCVEVVIAILVAVYCKNY